ncbi:MAG TPA: hypothetical protein VM187_13245, partial [Niastella sp.]|nr:hypothetical protein [Niastella sp.]
LWAIVGGADKGYVGKNAYMVNEINKRVPNLAHLTIRKGVGHGGWSDIYKGKVKLNGKNMWDWMYQFKRSTKTSNSGNEGTKDDNASGGSGSGATPPVTKPDPEETPVSVSTKLIRVNIYDGANPYKNEMWNNWNVGTQENKNVTVSGLKYEDGASSSVRATLSNTYRVVDNASDYGGGMAPAGVLRYASYSMAPRTLTLSGLSKSKRYIITLFGSRRGRPGNTTVYSINGTSKSVSTNNNHTVKINFTNETADNNGVIQVKIENLNKYNYLNGFVISEIQTNSGK